MKLCIADRQPRVRYGLSILLEQQPGWTVIGEAANAQDLIEMVWDDPPDVALIDCELPGMPLDALVNTLLTACPHLHIISLSGRYEMRQPALAAGTEAFASKAEPPEKLIQLILQITKHQRGDYP